MADQIQLTDKDEETRIAILLELLCASNVNADYCAKELMKIPMASKIVRQEVKMYFKQLEVLNDKLMLSLHKQFDFASADIINNLSQFIFDIGWIGSTISQEQREELVEELIQKMKERQTSAA